MSEKDDGLPPEPRDILDVAFGKPSVADGLRIPAAFSWMTGETYEEFFSEADDSYQAVDDEEALATEDDINRRTTPGSTPVVIGLEDGKVIYARVLDTPPQYHPGDEVPEFMQRSHG